MTTRATAEVVVRGRAARYLDTGTGEVVLLVHGIGRSLEDWTEQHDLLSDGRRVLSVDLPGFGWSERLAGRTTLKRLGAWLADFLDAVGVADPVHLVGNSFGGAVAMMFAVHSPERVRDLTLVNSAGFGREVTLALRLLALRPLAPVLMAPSRRAAARGLKGLFHSPDFHTAERAAHSYELQRRPHRAMVEAAHELGTFRGAREKWRSELLERVTRLDLPLLVVWGEKDVILPALQLEAARAALPSARTHLFEDTGHMPQIERAEQFAELVTAFWDEGAGA
jgi:pimeloyl-ACP methyl ester carboxylesterase